MTLPLNNQIGGHDAPVTEQQDDLFNRWTVARSIDRVIASSPQGWSTRIGLYGPWGSGKTSVLRFVRTLVEERGDIVVEFSAWQAQGEGAVIQLFHQELLRTLKARKVEVEPIMSRMKRATSKLTSWGSGVGNAGARAGASTDGDLGQLVAAAGMAVEMTSGAVGGLVRLKPSDLEKLQMALGHRRVVVFIDDLDRADPRVVPKTLLALRELLDWPNFAFVLAFDRAVVASALGEYSKAFGQSAHDFLEKVIDMPFELPEPSPEQVAALALYGMHALCAFIPSEARSRTAKLFPANPRQAKQVIRVLCALKSPAERHDPGELNWAGMITQTILRLAAPDVAAMFESRWFESRWIDGDIRQWVTLEERKVARDQAVADSLAVDRRVTELPKSLQLQREQWLHTLMEEIQVVRRNDRADQLAYEMRLVVEEPPFTQREVRELMEKLAARPDAVRLDDEIRASMSRSNASASVCAADLVSSSLVRLRIANDAMARALSPHTAEAARAELEAVTRWIEFVWKSGHSELSRATRCFEASSKLLQSVNAFAAQALGEGALGLLRRQTAVALLSAKECLQPWQMYFLAAPKLNRPSSALARKALDEVAASLAPLVAEEILEMFEMQDGLEVCLRRDLALNRVGVVWALEVLESPLYEDPYRSRLIALFERAQSAIDERAANTIQNANQFLSVIAMMSVDTGWISDYPSFATAQGAVLTAAWQSSISDGEEFRSPQYLAKLRATLLQRGLPEALFPIPPWMAAALEQPVASPF